MSNTTYEYHNFTQKTLPLISKHITLNKKSLNWINWHNNIEIMLVLSGKGYIMCNGIQYPLEKNDIFVINSNLLHYTFTDSKLKYHYIIIDSDFLSSNGIFAENLEYSNYIHSETAELKFKELIEEYETENPFYLSGVNAKLLDFMTYISRNFACKTETILNNLSSTDENIKKSINYIQSHLNEHLSIEDLASYAGLSKDYFSHSFKDAIGITPINYINQLRCDNAKKLLKTKKHSIHDIAIQCGFENDSYFSRTFKRYIGILPSTYQKNHS